MTQETTVFLLSFLLLLTPFLGIPAGWKVYIYVTIGIVLMIIGYRLRHVRYLRSIEDEFGERTTDSYMEATPSIFKSNQTTES